MNKKDIIIAKYRDNENPSQIISLWLAHTARLNILVCGKS
jgi:type IV secretory pathway ATPase VirB11/archaellum biosynthesis ATPase